MEEQRSLVLTNILNICQLVEEKTTPKFEHRQLQATESIHLTLVEYNHQLHDFLVVEGLQH